MHFAFMKVFEVQTANLIKSITILEKYKSDFKEMTNLDSVNNGMENFYNWRSDVSLIINYNFRIFKISINSFLNFE